MFALVGLAVIGLLATRLAWPRGRPGPSVALLVSAGAPLVVLGIALGPGIDLLSPPALRTLAPVTALAIGWFGAALGARFEWRQLRRIPPGAWGIALVSAAAALVVAALALGLAGRVVAPLGAAWVPRLPALLAVAAVAAVSGPGAVALAARLVGIERRVARRFTRAAVLETACGALALSVPLALHRPHPPAASPLLGWVTWSAGTVAGGALVSGMYLGLARLRPVAAEWGFVLVATLLFGAGLADAADLSPFLVCGLAAALLVNVAPHGRVLRRVLADGERPLYAAFLVLLGASLTWPVPVVLVAVPLVAALRIVAKWASVRYVGAALRLTRVPSHLGLATVAQGGSALALGLSFARTFGGPASAGSGAVLATVVLGVGVAQLAAPPLLQVAARAARAAPVPLTRGSASAELRPDASADRSA